MADETKDMANNEQQATIIRWVDTSYDIHEDLIGILSWRLHLVH